MENENQQQKKDRLLPASIIVSTLILAAALTYSGSGGQKNSQIAALMDTGKSGVENQVLPDEGVELPIIWEDLGAQMINSGVIDSNKFEALYTRRGGLNDEMKKVLYSSGNKKLRITAENSGFLLNLFWALGLANQSTVLTNGPMMDSRYGGAGRFASTGGWTLASGNAMDHYSAHNFIVLSSEQQALVERVAKNIYRPCCGNSVYFPDCNHGMAMLGLLELMAAQGVSEADMYKIALRVNSYWFPDTYFAISEYFKNRGISWSNIDPKVVLGADYSSANGYKRILQEIEPQQTKGGGGCGV